MRNAQVVAVDIPSEVPVNEPFNCSVTMKNTGTESWWPSDLYRLGATNPNDNSYWGTHRIELPHSVGVGATVQIPMTLQRNTVGQHDCSWRMVQDGVEWFGDVASKSVNVVNVPTSSLVEWNVPGITSLPYRKMIYNTGPVNITNGYHVAETWWNPFDEDMKITNSELWIGLALHGIADLHMEMRRASDQCEIQVYQNDRYSNPALPNNVSDDHPDPIILPAGDGITVHSIGQRLVPNPYGYAELAHFVARIKLNTV